jgi:flagellum-specific peptidoglycan hydrolase FlgJ
MKYGLTEIRNFSNLNYDNATLFVRQNWMKMILIFFVLFIILKKDISLNLDLQAAGSRVPMQSPAINYEKINFPSEPKMIGEPEAVKSNFKPKQKKNQEASLLNLPYFKPKHSLEEKKVQKKVPKIGKDNRANTFANLAFILNSTYARRKNIDREIVMEKQETVYRYVKRYADVAVAEMEKYGIPASITLAQGLLESDAGESRLARTNNNHFGLKCFSKNCQRGHCANFTDDSHKDFFRKHSNVWESYRAHSTFLQRKRYAHLQKLGRTNYVDWAHGLKEAGYATDKKYANKLIKIIETLNLDKYDSGN